MAPVLVGLAGCLCRTEPVFSALHWPPRRCKRALVRALARLPGAAAVAPLVGMNGQTMGQYVSVDHRLRYLVDIPKVLAGRLPLPDRLDEIALDQNGAVILHVHVGSALAMEAIRSDGPPSPAGARKLRERVVGIVVTRSSVKPVTDLDKFPMILVSAAFMRDLGPGYIAFDGAAVPSMPPPASWPLSARPPSRRR